MGAPNRRYIRSGRGMSVGPTPRNNGIAISSRPPNRLLRAWLNRPHALSRDVRLR